jgi:putative acetyltransferase
MSILIELQKEWNEDIEEIIRLGDEYLSSLYPPESNHLVPVSELISDKFEFYLLRVDGESVGSVGIRLDNEHPEVKRMFVKSQHRGYGYGEELLKFIFDRCRESGFSKIQLETGIAQPEAIGVYEKHGFRRIPPFGSYEEDPLCVFYEANL